MRSILLIEDDREQADQITRVLRAEGFVVRHAATFAEGLELRRQQEFDCKVVDLGLPDADLETDYDTVARFGELGGAIVAITGSGDKGLISAVRKMGGAIVLKSPGGHSTGDHLPFGEMLIEKVWSQINLKSAGQDSELGQQTVQRRMMVAMESGKSALPGWAKWLVFLPSLLACAGFGAWSWRYISHEAEKEANNTNRFTQIESRMHKLEEMDARISLISQQNQISIDDRSALHSQINGVQETARDFKVDVIRRLERIEDKLDRKSVDNRPATPRVATTQP